MAKRSLPRRPDLDSDSLAQIAAIRRRANVIGHAFGSKRVGTEWVKGKYLTFYVREKYPAEQLPAVRLLALPERIGKYRTDVLPVRQIVGNDLDHYDEFTAPGHGTVHAAAVVRSGSQVRILMSGHAALPRAAAGWTYTWSPSESGTVQAYDGAHGDTYTAELLGGAFAKNRPVDWAVAAITGPVTGLKVRNLFLGEDQPLKVAPADSFEPNSPVRFKSPGDPAVRKGEVVHFEASPEVTHAGVKTTYAQLLQVRSTNKNTPFSQPGDSGLLVFDADDRAVGMIVGSMVSDGDNLSVIATIPALLQTSFSAFAADFFKK